MAHSMISFLPKSTQTHKTLQKISHTPTSPLNRNILKNATQNPSINKYPPFPTPTDTSNAIKTSKNFLAPSHEKISSFHIKHFGPFAIQALKRNLNYFRLCIKIPNIWELGNIISNLKPSKLSNSPSSYCLISLLSSASKL